MVVPEAQVRPMVLPVVPARAVAPVVGTPARAELLQGALAPELLVLLTLRPTLAAVPAVPRPAVLVVMPRVLPRLVVPPRVVPVLLAPRIAALAVPVVLPTPVLV